MGARKPHSPIPQRLARERPTDRLYTKPTTLVVESPVAMSTVKQQTDLEVERVVLGTILSGNCECYLASLTNLTHPGTWTTEAHAVIFDAIRRHVTSVGDFSKFTLQGMAAMLSTAGLLQRAGGIRYMEELLSHARSTADANEAVFRITEGAVRRQLATIGKDLQNAAADRRRETLEVILEAYRGICGVSHSLMASAVGIPASQVFASISLLEQLHNNVVAKTGYYGLDKELLGLRPGDVCVFAAYPQVDMTAFLAGMLLRGALPDAKGVLTLVATLRDPVKELIGGLILRKASAALSKIAEASLTYKQWERVGEAAAGIRQLPYGGRFLVCRSQTQSVEELRMMTAMTQQDYGVRLLIVEDPEVFTPAGSADAMRTARDLKQLAVDLQLAVVVLANLKKPQVDMPASPSRKDFEELGPLACVADTLTLMWHSQGTADEDEDIGEGQLSIFVARHWHRQGGTIRLRHLPEFRAYEDLCSSAPEPEQDRLN